MSTGREDRVRANTAPEVNARIDDAMRDRLFNCSTLSDSEISARIDAQQGPQHPQSLPHRVLPSALVQARRWGHQGAPPRAGDHPLAISPAPTPRCPPR